ncbi:hypothetical protein [[Limnothrix rosea] IAM M-220]|uniref:hypothetical protein n=1 Tax=[Limnothrix rosea] IAM M-220 TaxID=454133 RepID=UPI0009617BE2|nr:hypothetical protein [[Limnothrix rosea] IAM M-220]OKH17992.1 hypothetical protein NIES208_07420 [[Limnothrix rosea] IAM M-220]
MSDAASSLNLHTLEQDLQNRLHAEPSQTQPMQVRCVFKEGILIVLVQHGAPALPYPRKVFRAIRQFLYEGDILHQHQVLMYLRVEGSNQPYAFHTLTEQSKPPTAEATAAPTPIEAEAPAEAASVAELEATTESSFDETDEDFEEFASPFEQDSEVGVNALDDDADFAMPAAAMDEYDGEDEDLGFEGFTSMDEGFEDDDDEVDEVGDRRLGKATLAFAACLALAFSGTAFYVLTRPCVIDRCETMSRAEKLSEQSIKTFQSNPTGQQILTAQGQLDDAIKKLEAIPFWSPRYTEAQRRLEEYRALSGSLDQVVSSLFKASEAAQMSQNPPFPAEKWAEIATQWQAAIAGLSQVPPQDFFYPFAQSKIDAYERNLNAINQRLTQEEQAVEILAQAKEAAKVAQVQQGVAQSLDSWEQAYLSWANAVQKLETVAEGTTAYDEAQELISSYVPQMSDSKEQQDKETFARDIYNQGIRISQLARDAELAENWEEATFHWRNAIRYMEEVPEDTYQATLAKPAIARFNQAIESSQVQLQLYTRLRQAENDLRRTCAGEPNICTFTLDARNINVRLTAAYVNEVQETAVQASATNNSDAKIRILDHIATLEQALEVISKNTNVPVQVYDVNGVLLVDYKP